MTNSFQLTDDVKLVSFDVFDTVIARRCGAPARIFRLAGEKLVHSGNVPFTAQGFEEARVDAEHRARRHKGKREITLSEIYAELNTLWCLPQREVDRMIASEMDTERENLFVVPGALQMIQSARTAARRIAFLSDMYLPEEFIRSVLVEMNVMREGEALYVSSRWGVSKANGGLYRLLLNREGLSPSQAVHVGDSHKVDVCGARLVGMHAIECSRAALNRYELHLARASEHGSSAAGEMAGIARRVRLETDPAGEFQIAAQFGASIAGPLLAQYAEWVLRAALNRGLKRLYFLARDGQALMEICRMLAAAIGAEELELRYLYGSRQVWYPAALLPMNDDAAEFFAANVAFTADSWNDCVAYLGFNASDFDTSALPRRWPRGRLEKGDKRQIFADIAADPEFGLRLRQWLSVKSALVCRYLRESGLIDSFPCGLVDCGWSGKWTDIVSDIVSAQRGAEPEVFFIGRRGEKVPSRSRTFAFLYDHQCGFGLDRVPEGFHVIVEFFLTADHGRTVDFKEEGGRLLPVLAPVDLQGFSVEEWCAFRKALVRFVELYVGQLSPEQPRSDLRQRLVELAEQLWETPTPGEAELLGRHMVGLSPNRDSGQPLARQYRFNDLLRLGFRWQLPGYAPHWWHDGALALTPMPLRVPMATTWLLVQSTKALMRGHWTFDPRVLANTAISGARKIRQAILPRQDLTGGRLFLARGDDQNSALHIAPLAETRRRSSQSIL